MWHMWVEDNRISESSTVFGTSEEKIGTTPKRGNGWGGQMAGFELHTQLDSNVWLLPGGISKRYEEVSCMKESGVIKVCRRRQNAWGRQMDQAAQVWVTHCAWQQCMSNICLEVLSRLRWLSRSGVHAQNCTIHRETDELAFNWPTRECEAGSVHNLTHFSMKRPWLVVERFPGRGLHKYLNLSRGKSVPLFTFPWAWDQTILNLTDIDESGGKRLFWKERRGLWQPMKIHLLQNLDEEEIWASTGVLDLDSCELGVCLGVSRALLVF